MSSSYKYSRLDLSQWDPYSKRTGSFLELYYCNMVAHGACRGLTSRDVTVSIARP